MKTSSEVPPRVLLDTHTLLWALTTPERLPARVRATLESRRTELVVSAVSAWEVATKHRVGKLPDGAMLVGGWSRFLAQLGARELPVSGDHGLLGGQLEWAHRDPFDRMLAAQAILEGLPLVSGDRGFAGAAGVTVLW